MIRATGAIVLRMMGRANTLASEYDAAIRTCLKEREAMNAAEQLAADTVEAQRVAQLVAQGIQQHAHEQIAGMVSRCLAAVFDESHTFQIHFDTKRGKTEARFVFRQGGHEIDPMTASGFGMVDVAAFALRLSALLLARPARRRILILDEPFRFVSKEYRAPLRVLVETLSRELKVQFVIVTHIEEMVSGTVIKL